MIWRLFGEDPIVTSGIFTEDAVQFAADKPIELIDGAQLERLLGSLATGEQSAAVKGTSIQQDCPQCGSPLVKRTVRRGQRTGQTFWGCSSFSGCRYTRDI